MKSFFGFKDKVQGDIENSSYISLEYSNKINHNQL